MAVFPCAVGSHRYAGPQQTLYLGLVNNQTSARSKLRVCPQHAQEWKDYLEENLRLSSVGEVMHVDESDTLEHCQFCEAKDRDSTVYAHLYIRGEDPRRYWGLVCDKHALMFAARGEIGI
jgi:asparagine synthetase A